MATGIGAQQLVRTKLYWPCSTGSLAPRTSRRVRPEELRERPLTFVSAPAGYGKTTLVSSWLKTCDRTRPCLSLEEVEVEPVEGQQRGWIVAVAIIAAILALCTLQQARDTQIRLALTNLSLCAPSEGVIDAITDSGMDGRSVSEIARSKGALRHG